MNSVVVLSPSHFSLYTICVTELLRRNSVNIKAIIVRKLFNPSRILFEFQRDGSRLIRKILKKFVLRGRVYRNKDYGTMSNFMKKENINIRKVNEFKNTYGIPVLYCNDLNASIVVETLKKEKPNLVVFTGGGIIRKNVLENSGLGILNCHLGVLPQYRGMDVIEWPILEDNVRDIGMTVHLMDSGIDTGDILQIKKVDIEPNENFLKIYDKFEPLMCQQIVETCLDYMEGIIEGIPQKISCGKQYFKMHSRLLEIAEAKLNKTF